MLKKKTQPRGQFKIEVLKSLNCFFLEGDRGEGAEEGKGNISSPDTKYGLS